MSVDVGELERPRAFASPGWRARVVVSAALLTLSATVVVRAAGLGELVGPLIAPAAFLAAGCAAPFLGAPGRFGVQVWSLGAAHVSAVGLAATALSSGQVAAHVLSQMLYAAGFGLMPVLAAGFPNGRAGRLWTVLAFVAALLPLFAGLAGPTPRILGEGDAGPLMSLLPASVATVASAFFALAPLSGVVFAVRYVRHRGLRPAMRWPAVGVAVLGVLVLLGVIAHDAAPDLDDVLFVLAAPIVPVTLVLGSVRATGAAGALRRAVVVGTTWVAAAAAYGVGVAAAAWEASSRSLVAALFLAASVSVLLAAPVRRRLISLTDDRDRLTLALERRVVELEESRKRVAAATDRERVRVERDLHDGVQQQVLALMAGVELARARGLADDDADGLADAARGIYESVRQVSRGIRPAVLEDHGLKAAVEHLAQACPVPTHVSGSLTRWAPEVESALYFAVAEALVNVTKHADATRAEVAVTSAGVTVRDDGSGTVDPDAGTGIAGLVDRLSAVGGRLSVRRVDGWTVLDAQVDA